MIALSPLEAALAGLPRFADYQSPRAQRAAIRDALLDLALWAGAGNAGGQEADRALIDLGADPAALGPIGGPAWREWRRYCAGARAYLLRSTAVPV